MVLEFKPVQCPGPGIPHKHLTCSHHTLRLCPQNTHHPLFPTRWCSGSNSPLYNIRTSKLIKGPGLFRLLRVVPDFSSKLALVRFRREREHIKESSNITIHFYYNPVKLSSLHYWRKPNNNLVTHTNYKQARIFCRIARFFIVRTTTKYQVKMRPVCLTIFVLQVTNIVYGAVPSFGRCPNVRGNI